MGVDEIEQIGAHFKRLNGQVHVPRSTGAIVDGLFVDHHDDDDPITMLSFRPQERTEEEHMHTERAISISLTTSFASSFFKPHRGFWNRNTPRERGIFTNTVKVQHFKVHPSTRIPYISQAEFRYTTPHNFDNSLVI
ncbi:hypothetical protein Moror_11463 [Moniliophthora roreri MCA 2997]|uniref:Uncharacterized protein n=2 Tax=Moniliophthora roreri TaxID=221103 RepID=V2WR65_MONRO|nr:hypothetical protein Moror_11463 [Moniliophthora roreri MCA 2997]